MASHPSSNRDNTVTRSGRWFRSPTKRRARSLPKSDHSRQTNPARRMRSESRESSVRRNRVVKGQDIESLAASRTRSNASTNRSMSIGASPSTNNKKATPNNKYQSKSQKPKKCTCMRPDFGGDLDSGEWTIIALVVHFLHISRVLMFSFNDKPYHRRNKLKG